MARHRRRHKPKTPAPTLSSILMIAMGSLVALGGLVWLALAYNHLALLAVLLPIVPVFFSFFIEQIRRAMEEVVDDDEDESVEEAQEPPP